MSSDDRKMCPIVLRIFGLMLLLAGAVLTESRSGDWFFRSEMFEERFSSLLLGLRIAAGLAGIFLIFAGGKLGSAISRRWQALSESGKLLVVSFLFVLAAAAAVAVSQFLRSNMVLIETITPYQARFKILGFSPLVQLDGLNTPDYLTSIFLAVAGTIACSMYCLHRLGVITGVVPGKPDSSRMWLIFSFGFFFLSMDEYFGFHEILGDNCPFFCIVKITRHPDDQVIGLYFLAGLAIMSIYRRYLIRCKPALVMMATGLVLHFIAFIVDAYFDSYLIEEGLELSAIIFYCGAIAQYALNEILLTRKYT